ncbi:glycoside hydrolase family 43 protein [Bacteroides uniformis]|uniref:Beta-xylosidase n=1 Tax=Bacteroides uniformis TaxID=820 RepID=A0AA37JQK6_BACUN|nr:glycoside hydrolase 43 family protein [Bacteroides uniformis]GKH12828.1 beta-xylosidase [Bacteroides uniformis]GKH36167.1 beta-xylosidase [Bacteroides uniformis]
MCKVYLWTSCLLLMLLAGCTNTKKNAVAEQEEATFTNPVIYSDVPDVDVIRIGSDYYMVSTTAHMSPGAPIMHSKDLVNWKIISYVFDEINESPKNNLEGGNIYSRGQWAASLRYHDGLFYVFFGTGNKSYIYTAKDPAGKWEQKLVIDEYLHDASMLFDDDGKIYLAYGARHIRIIEFYDDLSGINPNGLNVEVVPAEPKGLLEGVHFYKFGKQYYMTFIWWPEGGIRTQLCFRSDKVAGPYTMKVILSDDMGYANHGVAQGCFIDTEEGEWYAMLFQDHEAVGRVPVLMPCRWEDGWPMLGDENGKVPPVMEKPIKGYEGKTELVVSDDFDDTKLGLTWQWNHNPDNMLWSLTERPGYLRLKTGKVVTGIFEARNTLTQRTEGPKCSGVVSLDLTNMKDGDCAGLAAFCSEPGTLTVTQEGGKKYLLMTDRGVEKARVEINQNQLYLKMDCDFTTDDALFSYSLDDREWVQLGDKFHMIFSMAHFTGNKFAIFNYATRETGGYVDVDFFRYNK